MPVIRAFGLRLATAMVKAPLPHPTSRPQPPSGSTTLAATPSIITRDSWRFPSYEKALYNSTIQIVTANKTIVRTRKNTVSTVLHIPAASKPLTPKTRNSTRHTAHPAAVPRIIPLGIQFL